MRRRRSILILLLFVLFIIEGAIVPWLIPSFWHGRIVPHFVFIAILFFSIYDNRHIGLVLGLSFGMLHDIVYYGTLIGANSFAMGLSAYLLGLIFRIRAAPLPLMMIIVILGSLLLDSILFGTYRLFELAHQSYTWALLNHIVPSLIIHFLFALVIYIPLRRELELMTWRRQPEDKKA